MYLIITLLYCIHAQFVIQSLIQTDRISTYNPPWMQRFMDSQTADNDLLAAAKTASSFNDKLEHEVRVAADLEPIPHLGEYPTKLKMDPSRDPSQSNAASKLEEKIQQMKQAVAEESVFKVGWQDDDNLYNKIIEHLIELDPEEQSDFLLQILKNEMRSNRTRVVQRLKDILAMIMDETIPIPLEKLYEVCIRANMEMEVEEVFLEELNISLDPIRNGEIGEAEQLVEELQELESLEDEHIQHQEQISVPIEYQIVLRKEPKFKNENKLNPIDTISVNKVHILNDQEVEDHNKQKIKQYTMRLDDFFISNQGEENIEQPEEQQQEQLEDNQEQREDNQEQREDNQEQLEDNQEQLEDNQEQQEDNQEQLEDNQEQQEDNQEQLEDNQEQLEDNQGQLEDNQQSDEQIGTEQEIQFEPGPRELFRNPQIPFDPIEEIIQNDGFIPHEFLNPQHRDDIYVNDHQFIPLTPEEMAYQSKPIIPHEMFNPINEDDKYNTFGNKKIQKEPYFHYNQGTQQNSTERKPDVAQSINIVQGDAEMQSINIVLDPVQMQSININFDETQAEQYKQQQLYHKYRNQKHFINRDSFHYPNDPLYPDIHTVQDHTRSPYYYQGYYTGEVPQHPYQVYEPPLEEPIQEVMNEEIPQEILNEELVPPEEANLESPPEEGAADIQPEEGAGDAPPEEGGGGGEAVPEEGGGGEAVPEEVAGEAIPEEAVGEAKAEENVEAKGEDGTNPEEGNIEDTKVQQEETTQQETIPEDTPQEGGGEEIKEIEPIEDQQQEQEQEQVGDQIQIDNAEIIDQVTQEDPLQYELEPWINWEEVPDEEIEYLISRLIDPRFYDPHHPDYNPQDPRNIIFTSTHFQRSQVYLQIKNPLFYLPGQGPYAKLKSCNTPEDLLDQITPDDLHSLVSEWKKRTQRYNIPDADYQSRNQQSQQSQSSSQSQQSYQSQQSQSSQQSYQSQQSQQSSIYRPFQESSTLDQAPIDQQEFQPGEIPQQRKSSDAQPFEFADEDFITPRDIGRFGRKKPFQMQGLDPNDPRSIPNFNPDKSNYFGNNEHVEENPILKVIQGNKMQQEERGDYQQMNPDEFHRPPDFHDDRSYRTGRDGKPIQRHQRGDWHDEDYYYDEYDEYDDYYEDRDGDGIPDVYQDENYYPPYYQRRQPYADEYDKRRQSHYDRRRYGDRDGYNDFDEYEDFRGDDPYDRGRRYKPRRRSYDEYDSRSPRDPYNRRYELGDQDDLVEDKIGRELNKSKRDIGRRRRYQQKDGDDQQPRIEEFHIYHDLDQYSQTRNTNDKRNREEKAMQDPKYKPGNINGVPQIRDTTRDFDDYPRRSTPEDKDQMDSSGIAFAKSLKEQGRQKRNKKIQDEKLKQMGLKNSKKQKKNKNQKKKKQKEEKDDQSKKQNQQQNDEQKQQQQEQEQQQQQQQQDQQQNKQSQYKVQALAANKQNNVNNSDSLVKPQNKNTTQKEMSKANEIDEPDLKHQARNNAEKSDENKALGKNDEPLLNKNKKAKTLLQISDEDCSHLDSRSKTYTCIQCNTQKSYHLNDDTWYLIGLAQGYKKEFHTVFKLIKELINPQQLYTSFGTNNKICFSSQEKQIINLDKLITIFQGKKVTNTLIQLPEKLQMSYFQLSYSNQEFSDFELEIDDNSIQIDKAGVRVSKINIIWQTLQVQLGYQGIINFNKTQRKFDYRQIISGDCINENLRIYLHFPHDYQYSIQMIKQIFNQQYIELYEQYLLQQIDQKDRWVVVQFKSRQCEESSEYGISLQQ